MSQTASGTVYPEYTEKIHPDYPDAHQPAYGPSTAPGALLFDFSVDQAQYDFTALNRYLLSYTPHLNDYVGNTFRCLVAASMREIDAIRLKWHCPQGTSVTQWLDGILEQVVACNSSTALTQNLIADLRTLLFGGKSSELFQTQLLNMLAILDIMRQQAETGQLCAPPARNIALMSFGRTFRSPYAAPLQEARLLIGSHARPLNLTITETSPHSHRFV